MQGPEAGERGGHLNNAWHGSKKMSGERAGSCSLPRDPIHKLHADTQGDQARQKRPHHVIQSLLGSHATDGQGVQVATLDGAWHGQGQGIQGLDGELVHSLALRGNIERTIKRIFPSVSLLGYWAVAL